MSAVLMLHFVLPAGWMVVVGWLLWAFWLDVSLCALRSLDVYFVLPALVAHFVLPAGWMATGCLAVWPDVSICAVRWLLCAARFEGSLCAAWFDVGV